MRIRYLLGVWLVLIAASLGESALGQTEYLAVFMEGKKVGYAIQTRLVSDGKVTTTEKASITLSRMNFPMTINITEISIETIDGRPLAFEALQELSMMATRVSGIIDREGMVNLTTVSMGAEQKRKFQWPTGAVMAEGLRLLTLKKGLREGLILQFSIETDTFWPSAKFW